MQIRLKKLSDSLHVLEIERYDRTSDSIELVSRESLTHDFLHFAVEQALPTQRGFWGTLASGRTFADLNDRSGESVKDNAEVLYMVEGVVGAMTTVFQLSVDEALQKLRWFSESQKQAPPSWCTERFVREVSEQMRRLLGQWKATAYGDMLEVTWNEE